MAASTDQTRNIALCGHSGAGKTTLSEAMLFNMKVVNRMGRIADGSTVSDFDKAEIDRKMSLRMALMHGDWRGAKLNIIDTPGYADFIAEAKAALRIADAAVVAVDGVAGVEIGTERVWRFAEEFRLPTLVVINKMDRAEADPDRVVEMARERLGKGVVPLQMAVNPGESFNQLVDLISMKAVTYKGGKAEVGDIPADQADAAQALREQLVEAVAETDEALLEKFFGEGELSQDDLLGGLRSAILSRALTPAFFSAAQNDMGVDLLMTAVAEYLPGPAHSAGLSLVDSGEPMVAGDGAPLAAFVFKTIAEQHVGDLTLMRVYTGHMKPGDEVFNSTRGASERIGQMFRLNGHNRVDVEEAAEGDIVALVKLKDTHTGNTLCTKAKPVKLPVVEVPEPLICVAVEPKEKGSEDRMATGMAQIHDEDPSFTFRFDPEVRQSLLFAQGELHLDTIVQRLKGRYGVEVNIESPRIPYRETIRGTSEGHHRHKKQSGGRGQFGEVQLRISPRPRGEGFDFGSEVVGGNIPGNFIPAIEKGIVETLVEGPVAGYKVVDVGVSVLDGKYHAVDSDEVSFKIAGSVAFKDAFLKAKPILLEPIYSLTITIPEEYMGDVMGDLSSRRGRISGMDTSGHSQIIRAEVPLSELERYATTLRSMTQGKGIHSQKFERYEEVPGDQMAKVVDASKKAKTED